MLQAERNIRDFIELELMNKFKSQSAFAQKSGLSRNQVNEFLRGKRDIKLNTLLKYLSTTNITLKLVSSDHSNLSVIHPDDMRQPEFDQFL